MPVKKLILRLLESNRNNMPIEFCPICENYLYLDTSNDVLSKSCKTCGFKKETGEGGIIMETIIQAKSSEEYRYVVNEFTKEDPRLPHYKNLKCPNTTCPTASGQGHWLHRNLVQAMNSSIIAVKHKYIYRVRLLRKKNRQSCASLIFFLVEP